MATETLKRFASTNENKLYPEQIITTDDHITFKIELLDEFKKMFLKNKYKTF